MWTSLLLLVKWAVFRWSDHSDRISAVIFITSMPAFAMGQSERWTADSTKNCSFSNANANHINRDNTNTADVPDKRIRSPVHSRSAARRIHTCTQMWIRSSFLFHSAAQSSWGSIEGDSIRRSGFWAIFSCSFVLEIHFGHFEYVWHDILFAVGCDCVDSEPHGSICAAGEKRKTRHQTIDANNNADMMPSKR